jgi:hypothetical protein
MSQDMITLKWYNDDGEEIEHTFPSCNEVCPECEGYGTHLNPNIREHAYSMEEFEQEFDEEGREQYFKHGGIYDVRCQVCRGNKVIQVAEESLFNSEQKSLYEEYQKYQDNCAQERDMDRAIFRMETGYRE